MPSHSDIKQRIETYYHKPVAVTIKEYVCIIFGLFPFALMVNWIFVPHNVVGGGLTGICSLIFYATQGLFSNAFTEYGGAIPIWLSSLSINILLLVAAIITVGWRFCIRTIVGVFTLAFWYRVIPLRTEPLIQDPVTACIVGGIVFGIGLGIAMVNNGSSGGTDIIAMIVNQHHDISLGRVMVICDFIIIASSYLLPVADSAAMTASEIFDFKIKRIMYGLCMTVSYTFSLDWFMTRMHQSVQLMIVSKHYDQIATAVNQSVHRGVTVLDGTGWYSQQPIKVVTVMARESERGKILKIVKDIDPDAFVSETQASAVFGRGFDKIKGA